MAVDISKLNVREHPNTSSRVLGVLSQKTQVKVLDISDGWARILYDEMEAYISAKYIVEIDNQEIYELYRVISVSNLNVRNKPSTNSEILGTLNPDTQITVLSVSDKWAKIIFNDKTGYVSAKYIEKIEVEAPEESEQEVDDDSVKQEQELLPEEIEVDDKPVKNNKHKIGIDIVPEIYCGYSNFLVKNVSPIASVGVGIEFPVQVIFKEPVSFIPKNYFAEASFGCSKKGSAAFNLYYFNIKILPFCYRYSISDVLLYGKLGLYTGFTPSEIKTEQNTFSSNVDFGMKLAIGAEYKRIGLSISYEQGFTKVCTANLKMRNTGVFFNVSYRLFTFDL